MNSVYLIVFFIFGTLAVIMFQADVYFPIWFSVMVLGFVSLYLLQQYRRKRLGILMLLIWLVYVLPFIHIPPYLFFDFSSNPLLLWGLVVNPYMVDERVIALTAMIGAVGGMGIGFGASLNNQRMQEDYHMSQNGCERHFRTLSMPIWLVWVVIGVALTAMSAPRETIFTSAYTESGSILERANFASAWMMSYVILTFAFSDALLERQAFIKSMKKGLFLASLLLVVVYFQIMRGDRESVPWVFGLALCYYYWAAGITQRRGFTIPWLKIIGVAFGLVTVTMVLGAIRTGLSGASLADAGELISNLYESDSIGIANTLHGTWSATLLTPLSVAGDHIHGLLAVKWGQDYLDLFLSIIPGFLADAIGYTRPIDSNQGPAWEMRYGLGGTHATVVPFMNLRMFGVFLVPVIWTIIIVNYEKMALRLVSAIKLSLLVTIAMAAPHWLWYGEKNGFNAIVLWLIFSFFYRLSLGLHRSSDLRV
jgi:hypothetical protein